MPTVVEREPTEQCRVAIDLPSGRGLNLCFENESDLETALRSLVQSLDEEGSLDKVFKIISNHFETK